MGKMGRIPKCNFERHRYLFQNLYFTNPGENSINSRPCAFILFENVERAGHASEIFWNNRILDEFLTIIHSISFLWHQAKWRDCEGSTLKLRSEACYMNVDIRDRKSCANLSH